MVEVKRTAEFDKWLKGLRNTRAKAKILVRIDRLSLGNPGDVAPVGEGVSEMRLTYGPGYRVYYKGDDQEATLLWGGDKSTQDTDIPKPRRLQKS